MSYSDQIQSIIDNLISSRQSLNLHYRILKIREAKEKVINDYKSVLENCMNSYGYKQLTDLLVKTKSLRKRKKLKAELTRLVDCHLYILGTPLRRNYSGFLFELRSTQYHKRMAVINRWLKGLTKANKNTLKKLNKEIFEYAKTVRKELKKIREYTEEKKQSSVIETNHLKESKIPQEEITSNQNLVESSKVPCNNSILTPPKEDFLPDELRSILKDIKPFDVNSDSKPFFKKSTKPFINTTLTNINNLPIDLQSIIIEADNCYKSISTIKCFEYKRVIDRFDEELNLLEEYTKYRKCNLKELEFINNRQKEVILRRQKVINLFSNLIFPE